MFQFPAHSLMNNKVLFAPLLVALVVAVSALSLPDSANAQQLAYQDGYQAGLGWNFSDAGHAGHPIIAGGFAGHPLNLRGGFFRHSFHRPENIPYFAKHPPVYYSKNIIRRPYGVSPFAAPPGIAPVEMQLAPSDPVRVVNPYVESQSEPSQSERSQPKSKTPKAEDEAGTGEAPEPQNQDKSS